MADRHADTAESDEVERHRGLDRYDLMIIVICVLGIAGLVLVAQTTSH